MKLSYYLSADPDKALAPLFAPRLLKVAFTVVLLTGISLALLWPQQSYPKAMATQAIPAVFFYVCATALIAGAYANLSCGCGDMVIQEYYGRKYRRDLPAFEIERPFVHYGLMGFIMHVLILQLPVLPLIVMAAAFSAVTPGTILQAFAILYTSALTCRLVGFLVYFFCGRHSTIGYLLARAFLLGYLWVTSFGPPFLNPVYMLSLMTKSRQDTTLLYLLHIMTSLAVIVLLTTCAHLLVKRRIEKG
jgi:hypothetical protein